MVLHPVGPDLVEQAAARIEGRVRVTPVVRIEAGGLGPTPVPVILKLELLQHTGSFKPAWDLQPFAVGGGRQQRCCRRVGW